MFLRLHLISSLLVRHICVFFSVGRVSELSFFLLLCFIFINGFNFVFNVGTILLSFILPVYIVIRVKEVNGSCSNVICTNDFAENYLFLLIVSMWKQMTVILQKGYNSVIKVENESSRKEIN